MFFQVYFPTMLAILGYLKDSHKEQSSPTAQNRVPHDEVKRVAVIYADWKRRGDANPLNFFSFERDLIRYIR
jgi:hypothetical protein